MGRSINNEQCKTRIVLSNKFRSSIPDIVNQLVSTCDGDECFDHVGPEPIPSKDYIIDLIEKARRILYPGYFDPLRIDKINLNYYFGQEITEFFDVLAAQIILSIRHECLRHGHPCTQCEERGQMEAINFIREMPGLRVRLAADIHAAYDGDPAAKGFDEIIFSYPGLFAVTVYRIAHQLFKQGIPLIPRIMTEYAHNITGIDIHPGADIGQSFFIDHGTGIVIGETTKIGDRVRIYQGVTLGALSLSSGKMEDLRLHKRHPTVEDDVIIYSNATILGGDTVIGARSVIGGNVWITQSIPPDTQVFVKRPDLLMKGKKK